MDTIENHVDVGMLSDCPWTVLEELPDRQYRVQCPQCGKERTISVSPENYHRQCPKGSNPPPALSANSTPIPAAAPDHPRCTGECPGDEYAALVALLGLTPKAGCQCKAIQADMNRLRVAGCKGDRASLIKRLQDNFAAHYSWTDLVRAARHARKLAAVKLLRKLRTLNPNTAIERLFDFAVENATR